MIKAFKRNLIYKSQYLLFFGFLIISGYANSVTLNGSLKGDDLRWLNGIQQSGYLTPSNWTPMSGVQPTTEWVPGTFMNNQPDSFILQNTSGDSVTISASTVGIQYNLGQASGYFTDFGSGPSGLSICGTSQVNSSDSTVIGDKCIADKSYVSTNSYTPFQFARPILSIDEVQLVQAFKDAKVPTDYYTGTVVVHPFYAYKSPTGNWTYSTSNNIVVTVAIRYEAANLSSIRKFGTGVIHPLYNVEAHTVSGSTRYVITADGSFTEGLKLTFTHDGDGDFNLKHDNADKSIPYSIDCEKCADQFVVKDGKINVANGETTLPGEGDNIEFQFKIHYDNVGLENIETGSYNDSFTVYFEENI